ncbi:MAG: hypothetical protein JOZ70_05735 [Pseudolabrys sp.]|nr:hypothetical protein [Pseudolabrys sp.]
MQFPQRGAASPAALALASLCLCLSFPAAAQYQWTCRTSGPNGGNTGPPFEGLHGVAYDAYIPVDHVTGPTPCFNVPAGPTALIYKGDGDAYLPGYAIQSWRVEENLWFRAQSQDQQTPLIASAGQSRNYGYGSPLNGSTLSILDEDGIPSDCFLWNAAGTASTANWHYDLTYPTSTQGQVHYYGTASNPLESSAAAIAWDMRTTIETANLDYITARVNYNHSCYPAHTIMVNDFLVYQYVPPRNDTTYITGCLLFQLGKIIGQQSQDTHVPCN